MNGVLQRTDDAQSRMPGDAIRCAVDCHVHLHSLERVEQALDASALNLGLACGRSRGLLGYLLLAQGGDERVFEALADRSSAGGWRFASVPAEPETLIASSGRRSVAVVCGRQVRAVDGLEVLAIGTCASFHDGQPFTATLDSVRSSGALAVIPWGFGKWFGKRGRRVRKVLQAAVGHGVFVGDNGGRLAMLGMPRIIRNIERQGGRVLPGTDPFPIAMDHLRIGAFGFLRSWIESQSRSPPAYGRASGLARFTRLQIGIQLHNRLSNPRPA
jgi:hypothetical protein